MNQLTRKFICLGLILTSLFYVFSTQASSCDSYKHTFKEVQVKDNWNDTVNNWEENANKCCNEMTNLSSSCSGSKESECYAAVGLEELIYGPVNCTSTQDLGECAVSLGECAVSLGESAVDLVEL